MTGWESCFNFVISSCHQKAMNIPESSGSVLKSYWVTVASRNGK